jgi:hypothetical protein
MATDLVLEQQSVTDARSARDAKWRKRRFAIVVTRNDGTNGGCDRRDAR